MAWPGHRPGPDRESTSVAPGMNSPASPATSRVSETRVPVDHRPTTLSGRRNAGLEHRTEQELLRVREPVLAWHKDLAPDRTRVEVHAPVMARPAQGAKQDPIRPSSPGRSRTRGLTRARRTRQEESLLLIAGPMRGLDRAVPAQGPVLREPGLIRESLCCRTSNQQVRCRGVLIQAVSLGSSRLRQQALLVRTVRLYSASLEFPESEPRTPSRARPGRGPAWPGPATPIPCDHQRPATCRRRALPQIRECRV